MNSEQIFRLLCENIREVLQGLEDHTFSRGERLAELGANSVDRSEIVMMTLEKLDLRIPLVETFGPRNIGELADLLSSKL
jgi:polyketide biosynthesis acyl carrier protein